VCLQDPDLVNPLCIAPFICAFASRRGSCQTPALSFATSAASALCGRMPLCRRRQLCYCTFQASFHSRRLQVCIIYTFINAYALTYISKSATIANRTSATYARRLDAGAPLRPIRVKCANVPFLWSCLLYVRGITASVGDLLDD
jgi:hypothetical protein